MPDTSERGRPACERCRKRRIKCDRTDPSCGQCAEVNAFCEYKSRNAASIFLQYAMDLEAEIAQLEQELGEHAVATPMPPLHPIDAATCEEPTTVENANTSELDMSELIESISKVSLSATTEEDVVSLQSHDILTTLILSAAVPAGFSQVTACSSSLPPRGIVENVIQTYLQHFQPNRPFVSRTALLLHLDAAYAETQDSAYSVFLVGVVVATTVVSISPASLLSALPLYYFSVQRLAVALGNKASDHLRELEAVVALASFAHSIGIYEHTTTSSEQLVLPDCWNMTGLGIRIAVDHGLHHSARIPREKALFNAAFALDVEAAKRFNLPIGLPEAAIHTRELPSS